MMAGGREETGEGQTSEVLEGRKQVEFQRSISFHLQMCQKDKNTVIRKPGIELTGGVRP